MAGDQPPKPANDNAQAAQKPANDNAGKTGPPPGGAGGGDKAPASQPPADKPSQPQQQGQQPKADKPQGQQQQQGQQGEKYQQQAQGDKGQPQGHADKGRQVPGEAGPPANDNTPRARQPAHDNTQPAATTQVQDAGQRGSEAPAGVTAGAGDTKRADTGGAADQVKSTDSAAARTGDAKPANDRARSPDAARSTDASRDATGQNGRNDGSVQTRSDQSTSNRNDSGTDRKEAENTDLKAADKEAKQDKLGGAGGDSAALAATGTSSRDANAVTTPQGEKVAAAGSTAAHDKAAAGAKAVGDEKARLESAGKLDEKTKSTLGAAQHDLTSVSNRTGPGVDRGETLQQPNGTASKSAIEGHKGPAEAAKPAESKAGPHGQQTGAVGRVVPNAAAGELTGSVKQPPAVEQGRPGRRPSTMERIAARQAKADKRADELRKRREDRKENRKLRKEAKRDAAEKKDLFHGMSDKQKADCINQYRMQTEAAVRSRQDNPRTAHLYPKDFDAKRGAATWEESMRKNFSKIEMKVGSDGKTRYLKTPRHPKDHIKDGSLREKHQFMPGDKLDRCGSNRGRFGSVEQTKDVKDHGDIQGKSNFDDRALPGSSISADYSRFRVNKPFACDISQAAPSATRPGGGWQIDLSRAQLPIKGCEQGKTPDGKDLTFKWMVDNGYLRETYTTRKAK